MQKRVELLVHGRGNAWPVFLGETHPFYDRNDPRDLSNASYSLVSWDGKDLRGDVLVDAGHGTIQSLITGTNRIPDAICLTHAHMDHTLAVDWVVQSFWQKHRRPYPLYATGPVYDYMIQSYPQLAELVSHRELLFGVPVERGGALPYRITAFPVYHGQSAFGASMLLFESGNRKILFTGDILTPLLRQEDYEKIKDIDLLVTDTNNRFPWPRTNHWSFAGGREDKPERGEVLRKFIEDMTWERVTAPHMLEGQGRANRAYFDVLSKTWNPSEQPWTLLEFLRRVTPGQVVLVHYSGTTDLKYHGEEILTAGELAAWATETASGAGTATRFIVPAAGQVLEI